MPKLTCGGTERAASELANHIASNGGNVTVLLMYNEELFYSLHQKVRLIQPPAGIRKRLGRFLYTVYLLPFLRSKIKVERPDLIFALGYIAFTLAASRGLPPKVIVSWRSSPTRVRFPHNKILNLSYGLFHRLISNRVDGIIAQTRFAAKVYAPKYNVPIKVIPNFLRNL
ncbi:MAG: glycosyltransferase, partial [Ferruginibacter sp.]|nr:glycosyltransferase [Ferruginibacter sp.]